MRKFLALLILASSAQVFAQNSRELALKKYNAVQEKLKPGMVFKITRSGQEYDIESGTSPKFAPVKIPVDSVQTITVLKRLNNRLYLYETYSDNDGISVSVNVTDKFLGIAEDIIMAPIAKFENNFVVVKTQSNRDQETGYENDFSTITSNGLLKIKLNPEICDTVIETFENKVHFQYGSTNNKLSSVSNVEIISCEDSVSINDLDLSSVDFCDLDTEEDCQEEVDMSFLK